MENKHIILLTDYLGMMICDVDQSVSFSPMHLTLWRLNQLSASAIFPRLTISLLGFCVTLLTFVRIGHCVFGTAKIQFFPL
jgi:hypothetical protein